MVAAHPQATGQVQLAIKLAKKAARAAECNAHSRAPAAGADIKESGHDDGSPARAIINHPVVDEKVR